MFFFYILLGCLVGFLSGLLGVGGGMTIVPTLLFFFTRYSGLSETLAMHLAIGTSLATIVVTTISTTHAHHKRGAVLWPLFWSFAPGIVLGALILGPITSLILSGEILRKIFAFFCAFMAFQMLTTIRKTEEFNLNTYSNFFNPGVIIGTLSSILGIAGGSLATVLLNWYKISMHNIVATTAAIGLPVAICGTIGFIFIGWHVQGLPKWSSGFVYWPAFIGIVSGSVCTAPLGVMLAHSFPVSRLKKIFAGMLIVMGVELFWF